MSSASGAAGAAPPLDPPPKLGLPGSRPGSLDGLATFQYVPESIQQVRGAPAGLRQPCAGQPPAEAQSLLPLACCWPLPPPPPACHR
jgi:hypothetical protein